MNFHFLPSTMLNLVQHPSGRSPGSLNPAQAGGIQAPQAGFSAQGSGDGGEMGAETSAA
jgi:hypothetical protein